MSHRQEYYIKWVVTQVKNKIRNTYIKEKMGITLFVNKMIKSCDNLIVNDRVKTKEKYKSRV